MLSIGGAGGPGGNGGDAFGGIKDAAGTLSLTNCTIVFNAAVPGPGGLGGSGGWGEHGTGAQGSNGGSGTASGIQTIGGSLVNSLLATNVPGVNASGRLIDAGHNLSSDVSCAFTNLGSLNSTDPKLGLLADNGGSTWTIALVPGSPAIDAADTACAPSTDQRGFPRPCGAAADIGAFEVVPWLRISPAQPSGVDVLASGLTGPSCRLLTSSDLLNWVPAVTNRVSPDGTTVFHDNNPIGASRFYRVSSP
jgi:hypothetical protein